MKFNQLLCVDPNKIPTPTKPNHRNPITDERNYFELVEVHLYFKRFSSKKHFMCVHLISFNNIFIIDFPAFFILFLKTKEESLGKE